MVSYTGPQTFLLTGKETVFNTPVATTKDLGIIQSATFNANNNLQVLNGLGQREPIELVIGYFNGSLTLNGTLNSGAILELFFGQATDTATSTDYKHTFLNSAGSEKLKTEIESFTLSENYSQSSTDVKSTHGGCKVNTISMTVENGSPLNFSSEVFTSKLEVSSSAGTKVITSTQPLIYSELSLQTGTAGSEVTKNQVKSISFNFGNGINEEDIRGLGSRFNQDLAIKLFEVTGNFTMIFQNTTEAERFLGGSTPSVGTPAETSFIFSGNNGITLGSGRREFYVKGIGQYESNERNTSADSVVEENFTFRLKRIQEVFMVDQIATYY